MTLTKYRTTKLPEHYFKQIESFIAVSDKYVSVSEFIRNAVDEKLSFKKKQSNNFNFLILKDLVFTKTRLIHIHDLIAKKTPVENKSLLKKEFNQVLEESVALDMYEFLARFMYNFMKFHPFVDGNKRTTFVAVDLFLRLNNKKVSIKTKGSRKTKAEKFIWQVSIQQKSFGEIKKFLEKHTKPYLSSNDFEKEIKKCLQENHQLLKNLSE